ncbi:hypothetical protein ONS95_010396 [Cadophora gregata]|uniref:uncharacterized protein n=1 Tax=Cadophora gregata TaxID=51156 RepID=UPI0026DB9559|nr:uncharacterized protein ONS95_010396 [Cadophora gregata]KAK0122136.1 hypothetical protein ONS95_010396 [Cadophora gregata]KAK0127613.1 hypothetical protein ONS96_007139 [Cadophora gregata f. sp. sojae]
MSYMRVPQEKEAIDSWQMAIEGLTNNGPDDPLIAIWPTINLGLLYAVTGRGNEGYDIVSPILSARDKAFGRDDKSAFETGRILYVMGHILVSQGKPDDGLEFFLEALENLRVTLVMVIGKLLTTVTPWHFS